MNLTPVRIESDRGDFSLSSKLRRLVFNTALLTVSGLVMRCIALLYQVWLAGRIGAQGIGLFQLVSSVQALAATFAIAGVRFAATRLVSEELGCGRPGGVGRVMRLCLGYGLCFGLAALALLLRFAEPIGFLWIGDARTVLSLRLLSYSLPCVSLAAAFSGYFTAVGRVWKSALSQLGEQLVRIALVTLLLRAAPAEDVEKTCAAVVLGGTGAELFSFLFYLLLYLTDRRRHGENGSSGSRLPQRLLGVAVPLALSAYARMALSTLQHLLVPRSLRASGLTADAALAGYGIVHGMVLPIVTFPSCILYSLSELLVPTLTEAQMSGEPERVTQTVCRLLNDCLLFALGAAAVLFSNAALLGEAVYRNAEAGSYIRVFALLVPVMYLDTVTDGCLRGLGEQLWCMGVNVADSALSVALVLFLLPRCALGGYLAILFGTELFNFALSMGRLRRRAKLRLRSRALLAGLLCAVGAAAVPPLLLRPLAALPPKPLCALSVLAGAAVYALLLKLCGELHFPRKRVSV